MPPPSSVDPSAETDAELITRIAQRDRDAFATLFRRYAGRIKALALRSGAGDQDADEIAQDVMVAVWRHAESYRPGEAAVSTWIYAIARNRRVDAVRRSRRPVPDPHDPLFQPDPAPHGDARLEARDRAARLHAAVAALSQEQRDVLTAAFFEELSHGEIAAKLGLPLGTVKSRIRLAFGHLRGYLGHDLTAELSDE